MHYLCLSFVDVFLLHISGHSKICYFTGFSFSKQNITCSKVPVNDLKWRSWLRQRYIGKGYYKSIQPEMEAIRNNLFRPINAIRYLKKIIHKVCGLHFGVHQSERCHCRSFNTPSLFFVSDNCCSIS